MTQTIRSTTMRHLAVIFKGIAMGTADMIPGVSGGTMAYILGIYERLLAAIAAVNVNWIKDVLQLRWKKALLALDWELMIPLAIGLVAAVVVLTKVVALPTLLQSYPAPVYGLFFGLITGSIWILLRQVPRDNLQVIDGMFLLIGIGAGLLIVTLTPTHTPEEQWFIFLCGALAISAMLLPGISGSFILLLLGKYVTILTAISQLNVAILLPFAAGCVVGLASFSRIIGWLMHRFKQAMTLIICGVLVGTLYIIWPFQERSYIEVRGKSKLIASHPVMPEHLQGESLLAVVLIVVGMVAVMVIQGVAARK